MVITSDFSETGPEGAALERAVVDQARQYGMRLVGPNTMGLFSAQSSLHALMPPVEPLTGPVSMFSQSGNVGTQFLAWGVEAGIGFEKFVSSGNEGDLTCVDYLKYFAEDEATRIIMAYLEGVDPDSDFLPAAREASRKKPVVVFKGGRTTAGTRAAASHSGALAGSYRIYQGVFRQAGLIEASTTQEIMDCTKALTVYPIPRGNRVAILTRGGGWGVITTDACEEAGLIVPPLPEEIIHKLDKILPRYWSRNNPVDMAAVITAEPFMECLETLAQWEGIDAVIALGGRASIPGRVSDKPRVHEQLKAQEGLLKQIAAYYQGSHQKVMNFTGSLIRGNRKAHHLGHHGFPGFPQGIDGGLRLGLLPHPGKGGAGPADDGRLREISERPGGGLIMAARDEVLQQARSRGARALTEFESKRFLVGLRVSGHPGENRWIPWKRPWRRPKPSAIRWR